MADRAPPNWGSKIMHARLEFSGQTLMGSDAPPERYHAPKGTMISVSVDKPEDADRIFQSLSEKGTVEMPIQKTFWAQRFGMLTDQFGTPWMINCEKPMG